MVSQQIRSVSPYDNNTTPVGLSSEPAEFGRAITMFDVNSEMGNLNPDMNVNINGLSGND